MTETVAEILDVYRAGAAKPSEIIKRSYARLRDHNDPAIFISLRDEAEVVAEAEALERGSDNTLPLYGIPVGVKDNIDVKGLPTTASCPAYSYRPSRDATAVARLRAAGAVIIGKTVTTEFAYFYPGKTRNPRDATRTPGGSSSGSAAAVAAGMVPLAIGSQTNGSVIRPAAFCGVYGVKPTHGTISRHGALVLSLALDHVGVFARSLADCALILDVLAGYDAEDPDSRLSESPDFRVTAAERSTASLAGFLIRT